LSEMGRRCQERPLLEERVFKLKPNESLICCEGEPGNNSGDPHSTTPARCMRVGYEKRMNDYPLARQFGHWAAP